MRNQWKRTGLAAILAMAILLTGCFAPVLSAAEGAEPYGDGDGVISRAQLAGLYNWLDNTNSDFFSLITFDQISDALGKKGFVKEKDRDEYRAAYWTDGDKFVTITFRNRDGSWGVTSVTTDIPSDEYSAADYSFLPRVGNRFAGSSATESQTLAAKVQGGSGEASVTAQVPTEYWVAASSFGEARFMNAPDPSKAGGNSAGLRVGFWAGEAALQADHEKVENLTELEDWAALGTTLKGYAYTKNGMDMTEYVLPLKDDLWMSLRFYKCLPYAGSEAEAIAYSLQVEYEDFTYSCDVQPEAPAVSAPAQPAAEPAGEPAAAPAAETDGGVAGKWIVEEMESEGETIRPGDYGMEMSIELLEDGTANVRLGEDGTGTWTADGSQISITIEGDTAAVTVENGVMILALGDDVSLKLVKDGSSAAAPAAEPEPTAEPAGEPTAAPAAGPLDADEEAYVGVWNLIYLGTGGFTGNAADIGLTGETLTMNADRTCFLSVDPDPTEHQWRMEDGIVRLENEQRLILLRDDVLQYGSQQSGYMIFSKDPAMAWDGSIPLFDPFAAAEPETTDTPAEPAPSAPDAPAVQNGGIQTEVKYTAKTYIANGAEMDASILGAEYSVVLHDDGTVDCILGGASVPGLLWKADGDAVVIDFYGNGEIRITTDEDAIMLDYLGVMLLKMVP